MTDEKDTIPEERWAAFEAFEAFEAKVAKEAAAAAAIEAVVREPLTMGVTLKKGRWVRVNVAGQGYFRARVKVANSIEGLRLNYKIQPLLETIRTSSQELGEDQDTSQVHQEPLIQAMEGMCQLLHQWVYAIEGLDLEGYGGDVVKWADLEPKDQLYCVQALPWSFLDLLSNIAGTEDEDDSKKPEKPPGADDTLQKTVH